MIKDIDPYYRINEGVIFNDDHLNVLKYIPEKSIDLTFSRNPNAEAIIPAFCLSKKGIVVDPK